CSLSEMREIGVCVFRQLDNANQNSRKLLCDRQLPPVPPRLRKERGGHGHANIPIEPSTNTVAPTKITTSSFNKN
ncbi:hypothetical protein L9F63_011692, partial [Diploptera punctata]